MPFIKCLSSHIAAALVMLSVLLSCARQSQEKVNVIIVDDISAAKIVDNIETSSYEEVQALWRYLTDHRRFAELADIALPYFESRYKSAVEQNKILSAMTGTFLAQAYLFLEDFDNAYRCLDIIDSFLLEYMDYRSSITVNNTKAMLALKVEMDYSKGMFYLRNALENAVALEDSAIQCPILCNMAAIYYARSDTSGLVYAQKAYDIAKRQDDFEMKIYGAVNICQIYMSAGRYVEAKKYIDEAVDVVSQMDDSAHLPMLRLLYGEICCKLGKLNKADSIFCSLSDGIESQEPGLLSQYLSKRGELMLKMGRLHEAKFFFQRGLVFSYSRNSIVERSLFLLGLSDVYDGFGDYGKALEYFRAYHHFIDSASFLQKERDFNQLLMNYDKMSYEQKIHEQEMKNMRYSRRMLIILFAFLLIALLLAALYMLYRRKNLMYQRLVERHQQYTRKMRNLEDEMQRIVQQDQTSKNESDAKDAELFSEIENIMKAGKVYRNNDISLEKLSDMLGSNRSYVSRCINKYSGMSFISYINIKRIEEAVARLSDLSDDTPLKAMCEELGFNSMSAFYRAFQKETGCPPSKYREGIKKMSEN